MAVTLIRRDERLELKYKGSIFYYRRVPMDLRSDLMAKNTTRGELDTGEFTRALLKWAVLGWDNVVTLDGEAIPYETELVDYLPDEVADKLATKVNEAAEQEEQERGN